MRGPRLALLVLAAAAGCRAPPDAAPEPAPGVAEHVRHLASEDLEGRFTGSSGERRAADYLAAQLRRIGARPLAGDSFLRPFDFAAGTRDAGSSLALRDGAGAGSWADAEQVRGLTFASAGRVSGRVVFAGYGLRAPDASGLAHDSYAGLDVEGKIALVLRYFPEELPLERRVLLSRYSALRYKAMLAREQGALALLVVTGPRSPNAGRTVAMTFDTAAAGSGIPAASISGEVADRLLGAGELERRQRQLDRGDPHATGFELPDVEVDLEVRVSRERRGGLNVIGVLPGADAVGLEKPYLVVGAHYDHLGRGAHGQSLAREGERSAVHPGADDNASGAAAVLAVGEVLASEPRRRSLVLALWSGEELGLLGSSAFLEDGAIPPGQIAAYLNFDMVGRLRGERLAAQAVGSSPAWPRLLEAANVPVGFDLQLQPDPYLPTDSASFNAVGVPALNFFTGPHADYHRPSDTVDRIDFAGLARVARLAAGLVRRLDAEEAPAFARVAPSGGGAPGRAALRAYTGTIPDYTREAEGLALADVVAGGPAERAGLRAGDVIVRFGSQGIANIYDYTYALGAARIDEPIEVIYLRDGERRATTIVPLARP